ncbi:MAG: glycerophosphodiester phosphodiesterase family protein, partial [Sciscionella sp.]
CLASFSDARLARLRAAAGPSLLTAMGPRSVLGLWTRAAIPHLPLPVHGTFAQVPTGYGPLTVVCRRLIGLAHRRRAEVHVWTIDTAAEMHRLLDMGVDGLVSDEPALLREVLRERGQWAQAPDSDSA